MYLHIIPRMINLLQNSCVLKSIFIGEFNFKLEGKEISTGRPYPNKNIQVGMRKGIKAVEGFLIKTEEKVKTFTVEYTWDIEHMGETIHRVTSYIEDNDFDLVSHNIMLNGGFEKWNSRQHGAYNGIAPAAIQPLMKTLVSSKDLQGDSHDMWEEYDWGNFLILREESLLLHTVEVERMKNDFSIFERLPTFEQAINI